MAKLDDNFEYCDPRQKLFWENYMDQKSTTFSNALQSGLKAGYSQSYSENITLTAWFQQRMTRMGLLSKAEKVLKKTLDMDTLDDGGKEKADLLRVQADVAKFIAKTLGKDDGYSEKTEVTNNGTGIVFMPVELLDKYGLRTEEDGKGAVS